MDRLLFHQLFDPTPKAMAESLRHEATASGGRSHHQKPYIAMVMCGLAFLIWQKITSPIISHIIGNAALASSGSCIATVLNQDSSFQVDALIIRNLPDVLVYK